MSDDIVTRIRKYDWMRDGDDTDKIMDEAANEIEKLRDELLDMTIDRDAWRNLTKLTWEKMAEKAQQKYR